LSIEAEIVEWALSRPKWQRGVLRKVAKGESVTQSDVTKLVDQMVADQFEVGDELRTEDLPSRSDGACIKLLEIRNTSNVNALAQDRPLTFDPSGITIVYGDNGSGKSGYARLVKAIVRARHIEPILTDVFNDHGASRPAAEIIASVNDNQIECVWPGQIPADIIKIAFFDEACGDLYVTSESEVTYKPSSLFVLDGLIHVCDLARDELEKRLTANARTANMLPNLQQGTEAQIFLSHLSADTPDLRVDEICTVPPEIDAEIARLASEEARLQATNPIQEKQRLGTIADQFDVLGTFFAECENTLGDEAVMGLASLHDIVSAKRKAADLASKESFVAEPVTGVGTAAWRSLWEVARLFAMQSQRGESFPPSGPNAKCPLCQQELDASAIDRLRRFENFVKDTTQRELTSASQTLDDASSRIELFAIDRISALIAVDRLAETRPEVSQQSRELMGAYKKRQMAIVASARATEWVVPALEPLPGPSLNFSLLAAQFRHDADAVDASTFTTHFQAIVRQRTDLEARRRLAASRQILMMELERLRARKRLEVCKDQTNTQGISKKAADLTRDHVTTILRDRFSRESDRLKLERVTLQDVGGKKGALQHQPAFVGAVQTAELRKVLSEGEQTALGMAGFFTEVFLDASHSAIVLDDPVSSLDHVRRENVAKRLAELARDRQTIIFTHDIAFVADLKLAAESAGVSICERSIERRPTGQPGRCVLSHPWKARDVPQRLQHLGEELARFRREIAGWDQQHYERETADWSGKLSETWERIINLGVVGKVVDRGTQKVHPMMFKILVKITTDDEREFQSSYSRCSRWARRHDKSIDMNYVPPDTEEMKEELEKVKQWWDRVRRYAE
jgi:energy-coupling factor transporter ATP-binding protein EcfA2